MGQAAVCLFATQLSLIGVLLASVAVYAGVGLILSPSQAAGLQTLLPHQYPHGVAILNTFIQIAASIGPSLFIGVLSAVAVNVQAEGTTAAVAQADGFAAAVAVACAIAIIGTVIAYLYARKRRALALAAVAEDAVADAELRAVDAIE